MQKNSFLSAALLPGTIALIVVAVIAGIVLTENKIAKRAEITRKIMADDTYGSTTQIRVNDTKQVPQPIQNASGREPSLADTPN